MRFSINCSAVICSPTVIISILIEASSETYGPRVYFPTYKFLVYNFSFLFTFFTIFYFLFHKPKIPKTLLYRLSISIRSHVAKNREGIDNPFIALGARLVFVCARIRWIARCLLLDWYLGSQNWGKYLLYFAASPFSLQGKNQRKLKK